MRSKPALQKAILRFRRTGDAEPLLRTCATYAAHYGRKSSVADVVDAAFSQVVPHLLDADVPVEDLAARLAKSIDTQRKSAQRRHARYVSLGDLPLDTLASEDKGFLQLEQRDYLAKLARLAGEVFRAALSTNPPVGRPLSDRHHDVVVLWLNLTSRGYQYRMPGGPHLPANSESRRKTFRRAKNDFVEIVSRIIEHRTVAAPEPDRALWRDLLRLVAREQVFALANYASVTTA